MTPTESSADARVTRSWSWRNSPRSPLPGLAPAGPIGTILQPMTQHTPASVQATSYLLCLVALLFLPGTRGKHLTG